MDEVYLFGDWLAETTKHLRSSAPKIGVSWNGVMVLAQPKNSTTTTLSDISPTGQEICLLESVSILL